MPPIFLFSLGPLLLVLHALCAVVLGGSSVHHAVLAVRLWRGQPVRTRLLRLYALVALVAYGLTLSSGALVYPRYRYLVRGLYFDRCAPWASNLFDFKENLATLGVPLAIGALVLARATAQRQAADGRTSGLTTRSELPGVPSLYGLMVLGTAAISLLNTIAGLLCTGVHGV